MTHVKFFHLTDKKTSFENRQKQNNFLLKLFYFRLTFCSLAGFKEQSVRHDLYKLPSDALKRSVSSSLAGEQAL